MEFAEMTVDEYEQEAIRDLTVDVTKLEDYAKGLGLSRAKWARYLFNEETILSEAEEKLAELYRERWHYYVYEYAEAKIEKKHIDTYIHGDKTFKEAEKMVKKQKSKVKMVEQMIAALDKQSFVVNTILKHMMWESGAAV